MTRYFMFDETGSVFTEEELHEWEAKGEKIDWSHFVEVRPIVDNPFEGRADDWEAVE